MESPVEQATFQKGKTTHFHISFAVHYQLHLFVNAYMVRSSNRDTAAESSGDDDIRVVLDGVEWRSMGDITVELNGPAYQRKAALHHPLHEWSTELDFWKMMMPADLMRNIIEATNQQTEMAQKPLDYEQL